MIHFINLNRQSIEITVQSSGNFVIEMSTTKVLDDKGTLAINSPKILNVLNRAEMYNAMIKNDFNLTLEDEIYLNSYMTANCPKWVIDENGLIQDDPVIEVIP